MSNFNPLVKLLKEGKHVGPSYMAWRRKVNPVRIVEEVEWAIQTPMPLLPAGHTSEQKEEFDKCLESNQKARL